MDDTTSARQSFTSGQLLARAGNLLFAPDPGPKDRKPTSGGLTYIWDVVRSQGFVLSEALQGYAPASVRIAPTNLITRATGAGAESVDGHPCIREESTVELADGTRASFGVVRATDLQQVALRINSSSNSTPLTLSLSKIRLELPAEALFSPPAGFTRYSSAETMMTELVLRQHNLKRPPGISQEPVSIYDSHPQQRH